MRTVEIEDMLAAQKAANDKSMDRYISLLVAVSHMPDEISRSIWSKRIDEVFGKNNTAELVEMSRKNTLANIGVEYDADGVPDLRKMADKLKKYGKGALK